MATLETIAAFIPLGFVTTGVLAADTRCAGCKQTGGTGVKAVNDNEEQTERDKDDKQKKRKGERKQEETGDSRLP